MYHPITMICDWPAAVFKVRPDCQAEPPGTIAPRPEHLAERCDPARPNSPHPDDCYKFFQCVDRLHGTEHVVKTCNPPTMYHPITMVCDWPAAVFKVRPSCQAGPAGPVGPAVTTAPPALATTSKPVAISSCVDGWSDWFNTHHPKVGGDTHDVEILPDTVQSVR